MARLIRTLSGRVKRTDPTQLDSGRFEYLTLDQAEPGLGVPESDGAVLISNTDGTRSFTNELIIKGLAFQSGQLDSADSSSLYALFVKGNPFDASVDSIGFRRISDTIFEADTLDTVTSRGAQTGNNIQVGGLIADSVSILGNLTVQGTTTTINSTVLTINDKNIVIADGAGSAAAADSAGITVAGANANIYYKAGTNSWNIDRALNVDSNVVVGGKLFINVTETQQTSLALYIDEVTGEVYAGAPTGDSAGEATFARQIQITKTDDSGTFYPLFAGVNAGIDSVNADSNFSYDPSINQLTLGRLVLNQLANYPTASNFLVIDSSNNVGFRDAGSLPFLDSEQDTLDTVTTRGDSTNNAITVGKVTTVDSVSVGSTLQFADQFLDGSGRRLVIYDSTGSVLWG